MSSKMGSVFKKHVKWCELFREMGGLPKNLGQMTFYRGRLFNTSILN